MKTLQIVLLTTGVVLFLALAGCGGSGGEPEVVPPPPEPEIEYARDISFDSLTAGQVQQLLQSQGKWKVEARYQPINSYGTVYDYPPASEEYIEFISKDTLRHFTDSGVTTHRIELFYTDVFFYDPDCGKYTLFGISNFRLHVYTVKDDIKSGFYCIPEVLNPDLLKPDFSQNVSLDGLPVYQMMQILSGTKWKVWQGCFDGHCSEAERYVAFEFVGTNTFRIIRDSVVRDYEIGVTVTPGVNGFLCSYSFWEHYPSLEEAGELISIVVLSDICNKQMTFRMSFANAYDFPESIYHCVLV